MSNSDKKARLILERWVSDLQTKDRSIHKVSDNFDELFHNLWTAKVSFDIAHQLVDEAVSAHNPTDYVARFTYKNLKAQLNGQSFTDFVANWKKNIKDRAYQSFYTFYPIDGDDQEEKKYGSMSAQEYSKQRKYANTFPELDIDALKKQIKETQLINEKDRDSDIDLDINLEDNDE